MGNFFVLGFGIACILTYLFAVLYEEGLKVQGGKND